MTRCICGLHQSVLPWLQVLCEAEQVKAGEEERAGTEREKKKTIGENRPVCADVVEVISVRIARLGPLQ